MKILKGINNMTQKDTILILDAENCPKLSKDALLANLKNKNCKNIVVAYAKNSMSFSLDEVTAISKHLQSGRVILHKMKNDGKNSADFGLTFLAGRISSQFKQHEVSFDVVSNDKDLEHLISMLRHYGFQANRITSTNPTAHPIETINKEPAPKSSNKTSSGKATTSSEPSKNIQSNTMKLAS